MGIPVRATQPGYYGHYREVDEEFSIDDEQAFSSEWMVRVHAQKTEVKTAKPAEKT